MLLRIPILLLLFSVSFMAAAQSKVVQRIFLVGDAGELDDGKHPVCDWLKQNVNWNDSSNTIVYLGDNIYPLGMPAEGSKSYTTAKTIIDYQISVVKDKNAKAFFVPGNHDWRRGKEGGLQQIQNAQQYIESLQLANVQQLPTNGCPGPVEVKIADNILLVCMDSEWWLEQNQKPGIESDCDYKNEDEVVYWEGNDGRYYVDERFVPEEHDKKEYDDWNRNKGQSNKKGNGNGNENGNGNGKGKGKDKDKDKDKDDRK